MTIPNRSPATFWSLRRYTYPNGWVMTRDDDRILIGYRESPDDVAEGIELSRRDARLLAKRINQALDATRKK